MAIVAGAFLVVFGALMVWWLPRQFPQARYTRMAYVATMIGGLCFTIWALTSVLAIGVLAVIALVVGGILGIVGYMRKELRISL